jgi:hypothetical protein
MCFWMSVYGLVDRQEDFEELCYEQFDSVSWLTIFYLIGMWIVNQLRFIACRGDCSLALYNIIVSFSVSPLILSALNVGSDMRKRVKSGKCDLFDCCCFIPATLIVLLRSPCRVIVKALTCFMCCCIDEKVDIRGWVRSSYTLRVFVIKLMSDIVILLIEIVRLDGLLTRTGFFALLFSFVVDIFMIHRTVRLRAVIKSFPKPKEIELTV